VSELWNKSFTERLSMEFKKCDIYFNIALGMSHREGDH